MRALALEGFDVAAKVIDVPEPVARPGEVLVRVHSSSVNAFDLSVAGGFMKDLLPYEFPAVIGGDVAGTIEALGEGVEGSGDEDFVTGLGAAETVDYTGDVVATIRELHPDGIDAVIDAVNRDPAVFASLAGTIRSGGRAASVVGGAGESTEIGGVSVSNAGGNPAHLRPLADLAVQGKLCPAIRRTYPLAEAAQALQDFVKEHTLGKLVITMT